MPVDLISEIAFVGICPYGKTGNLNNEEDIVLDSFLLMETGAYQETKTKIIALACAYYEADEEAKSQLEQKADFFPISKPEGSFQDNRSVFIRIHGQIFLVEDTAGGETGVFSMMIPLM